MTSASSACIEKHARRSAFGNLDRLGRPSGPIFILLRRLPSINVSASALVPHVHIIGVYKKSPICRHKNDACHALREALAFHQAIKRHGRHNTCEGHACLALHLTSPERLNAEKQRIDSHWCVLSARLNRAVMNCGARSPMLFESMS